MLVVILVGSCVYFTVIMLDVQGFSWLDFLLPVPLLFKAGHRTGSSVVFKINSSLLSILTLKGFMK